MSAAPTRGVGHVLRSAAFARAFTLSALGAVLAQSAIERVAGTVTLVTIVTGLVLLGIVTLLARRRELSLMRLAPVTVIAFVGWTATSVVWSQEPGRSLVGVVSLAAIAFLAIVIAQIRDTLQTARALGDVLRALLGVSLALEILSGILLDMPFPFLGIEGNIATLGPIQGLFGTRNALGFIAVIALITFLVEWRANSVRPVVSFASVVLAGSLAVLSASPAVLVLGVTVGLAALVLAFVRRARPSSRSALQLGLGAVLVAGGAISYVARAPIIALLDAGGAIATREDVWSTVQIFVRARPVQGWGWYGPWSADAFPFSAINYLERESHSSALSAYFDLMLQVGWVGVALFVLLGGTALLRSWLVASTRRAIVYAWTPLILIALAVESLAESFTLWGTGWMLLVLCAALAGRSRSWRELLTPPASSPDLPAQPVG